MTKFTDLEVKVLAALVKSSAGNGHDFGFVEDARKCVATPRQLAGVISSLVQKHVIDVYDPVRGDSGVWTQFKFRGVDNAEDRDAHVAKLTDQT